MAESSPKRQPPPASAQPDEPTPEQAAALAAVLIGAGVTAAGVAAGGALVAAVLALLAPWGYDARAVRAAITLTDVRRFAHPGDPSTGGRHPSPAVAGTRRAEPVFSAWFILNAARRIGQRLRLGRSLEDAIRPERRFLEQREKARKARLEAARKVDELAGNRDPGHLTVNGRRVLVWKAFTDDKVTPECRAADGRWFYADRPPIIGYPGMPHGGTCRCWPAIATAAALRGDSVDDAVRSTMRKPAGDHEVHVFPKPADRKAAS